MDIIMWFQIVLVFVVGYLGLRSPLEVLVDALEARLLEIVEWQKEKETALEARLLEIVEWQKEKETALEARQLQLLEEAKSLRQLKLDRRM
jgi:hypothetical protein